MKDRLDAARHAYEAELARNQAEADAATRLAREESIARELADSTWEKVKADLDKRMLEEERKETQIRAEGLAFLLKESREALLEVRRQSENPRQWEIGEVQQKLVKATWREWETRSRMISEYESEDYEYGTEYPITYEYTGVTLQKAGFLRRQFNSGFLFSGIRQLQDLKKGKLDYTATSLKDDDIIVSCFVQDLKQLSAEGNNTPYFGQTVHLGNLVTDSQYRGSIQSVLQQGIASVAVKARIVR